MQSWKKYTAVYFLLPVILLASTGFSLHSIYCLCKGERITSLMAAPQTSCATAHSEIEPVKACCKLSHIARSTTPSGYHADCCTEEVAVFFKATTESFSDQPSFKLSLTAAWVPVLYGRYSSLDQSAVEYPDYASPPRPGGRQWLALGQSLRC